ncbi:ATP-binding protein [Deinococcus sp. SL84]|uniref:ATP-binding protein n=1 Tax=Deinococcus sp. SL84 TaxID=2994663 RepID=UPI0022743341|nr:ATP-binding protein [Deinococcus sp. SL84]MCY1701492.1 ATP-binding protein [Deinococcus sp. SL84]
MNRKQFEELHGYEDTSLRIIDCALQGKCEQEWIDVKEFLPETALDWAELAKDVAGFYNQMGGYIIFGLDDNFEIRGEERCHDFDSKLINDKISPYLSTVRIKFASHRKESALLGVMYIPSKVEGRAYVWMEKDGPQKGSRGNLFRKRDIFIRDGDETKAIDNLQKIEDAFSGILGNDTSEREIQYIRNRLYKLIQPDYSSFIGRDEYKEQILNYLDPEHISMIVNIGGVGGIGKSALATWATHQLASMATYDVIITVSAKERELTSKGISSINRNFFSYEDLLREIITGFEFEAPDDMSSDAMEEFVQDLLTTGTCLLFIDNYETVEDSRIDNFLKNKLVTRRDQRHKALVTSRNMEIPGEFPIKLDGLNYSELETLFSLLADAMNRPDLTIDNGVDLSS